MEDSKSTSKKTIVLCRRRYSKCENDCDIGWKEKENIKKIQLFQSLEIESCGKNLEIIQERNLT